MCDEECEVPNVGDEIEVKLTLKMKTLKTTNSRLIILMHTLRRL